MKKLWKNATGDLGTALFRKKALKKFDSLEHGEKVHAPKHPTDQKHFDIALKDENIRKEVDKRRDDLIDRVNKINIHSTEVVEKAKSSRLLPTWENEYEYRNQPDHKYGYHEIPLEKMEKNTIMFREAYELINMKAFSEETGENLDQMEGHIGYQRLSQEQRDNLFKYFRPFTRKDEQKVVEKRDLDLLSDYMNNRSGDVDFSEIKHFAKAKTIGFVSKERGLELDSEARENLKRLEGERQRIRDEETKRLKDKLDQVQDK